MTTRKEHLEWCKRRALQYLPNSPREAVVSMMSDIRKFQGEPLYDEETLGALFMLGLMDPQSPDDVRRWVEGFN